MAENTQALPPATTKDKADRASLAIVGLTSCRFGSLRYNEMTRRIEVLAFAAISSERERPLDFDGLVAVVYDQLKAEGYKGGTIPVITAYLVEWAKDFSFHPVLALLKETEWDGVDRLPELYAIMGIEEDLFSQTLVRKWLYQCIAMLFNTAASPYGAEGVLVLNGAQGTGKTSLFRHLAMRPEWFLEGAAINNKDKDTIIRALAHWITELGELEATLKHDIAALKALITNPTDVYRAPYARADTEAPRRTSFCATCNSDRFLLDPTGNRRFWTVPIVRPMDYNKIQALNAVQLWAQIYAVFTALDHAEQQQSFRLSAFEMGQLAQRNGNYEKPIKAETECLDIIEAARANPATVWRFMTLTEWKEEQTALRAFSVEQIGAALKKIGIAKMRKRVAGQLVWGLELPTTTAQITPFSKEGRG